MRVPKTDLYQSLKPFSLDASKLGKKVKVDGKNQKTVLSAEEIDTIINTFNSAKPVDDFCVVVEYADIEGKKLSFSAGQYFEVKIKYTELSQEEFEEKIAGFKSRLEYYFAKSKDLENEIKKQLEILSYE